MKYDHFKNIYDVSRETFMKLEDYVLLLRKWQKAINLVSNTTLDQVWERHIIDSVQIQQYIDKDEIADLGTGAGFPGMVLAITCPRLKISLIESDARKCEFLREIKRKTEVNVEIINQRIEDIKDKKFDIIISRALASVEKIITLSKGITTKETSYILLKGDKLEEELLEAEKKYRIKYKIYKSITKGTGKILKIEGVI